MDPITLPKGDTEQTVEELRVAAARAKLPSPEGALNLHDISVSILSIHQAVITYGELINSMYLFSTCRNLPNRFLPQRHGPTIARLETTIIVRW